MVSPIDVPVIHHRLVDERVEVRGVSLQQLARRNRMGGVIGRGILAGGVEVGEHAGHPVVLPRIHGRRPLPEPLSHRRVVKFLKLPSNWMSSRLTRSSYCWTPATVVPVRIDGPECDDSVKS